MFVPSDFIEQLNERMNLFGKRRSFRSGNPLQPQALRVDSQQPEQLTGFFNDLLASHITFQVMAVADVSAGNQDTVRSFQKSFEQKAVIDPNRTHESYQTDVGRILHAGRPGKVCSGISAPVAHEGQDFGFISR